MSSLALRALEKAHANAVERRKESDRTKRAACEEFIAGAKHRLRTVLDLDELPQVNYRDDSPAYYTPGHVLSCTVDGMQFEVKEAHPLFLHYGGGGTPRGGQRLPVGAGPKYVVAVLLKSKGRVRWHESWCMVHSLAALGQLLATNQPVAP